MSARAWLVVALLGACSRQPRKPAAPRLDGGLRVFVREPDAGLDFEDPEHQFSAHFPGPPTFEASTPGADGGPREFRHRDFTYADGARPDAFVVTVTDVEPRSDPAGELDEWQASAMAAFGARSLEHREIALAGLPGRHIRFESQGADGGVDSWGELRVYFDAKAGRVYEIYYLSAGSGASPAALQSFLDGLRIHR